MIKKSLLLFFVSLFALNIAQIPIGYYDGTAGLTGATLKTKLSSIITAGHVAKSYDNLYNGYPSTDTDKYYENDNSVLDMYSEKPVATDPYVYQHGVKKCGNYSSEGDCYNREHIIPQSFFSSNSPMVSDIHFITPTDGKVNGMRSNNPFGKVTSPTFTSSNGSKLGPNTTTGFSGTAFEPIDEFKGDIARMIFYFVTRYESKLSSFSTGNMLGGSAYPGLQKWELDLLISWHNADPVSQREIDRNNAAYIYQGNRNPYIDNPTWVNDVWGGTVVTDTTAPTSPTNLVSTGTTSSTASLSWNASTDNISVAGYEIYINGVFYTTVPSNSAVVSGLAPSTTYSFYVIARDSSGNLSTQSNSVNATTLASTGGNPTSCGTETFETIPNNGSSYGTITWINNAITWTSTDSRTDQVITTGKAICVRNGSLTSSNINGGIGSLTVTTQREFTAGNDGTFNVIINGNMVGTVPFSSTATTTTIPNINVEGIYSISFADNSTSGNTAVSRVSFDDLSWTCYAALPLATENATKNNFKIYPNPTKNGEIFINGIGIEKTAKAEIYSTDGKLLQTINNPFINTNKVKLNNLKKGVYILKFNNQAQKFIVE